jgi:hypothetical protein
MNRGSPYACEWRIVMNKYRMVWQTSTGIPWQYDYDHTSDIMAIEYAKHVMTTDYGIHAGCMVLLVWRVEPSSLFTAGSEKLIAKLVLGLPVVHNAFDSPS